MVLRGLLKFFAGLCVAVLTLAVIAGIAGYFAVRNFDPNIFRAELEKYLMQQTGFRVELGDVKLGWRPQPRLEVGGLKLYHPQSLEKILQSDQVRIDADLTAVWQKSFRMSEIVIRAPEIFLKRDRNGVWNWQSAMRSAAPVAAAPGVAKVSWIPVAEAAENSARVPVNDLRNFTQGWTFQVGKIAVRDGTLHFTDGTIEPPYFLELERFDADAVPKSSAGTAYQFKLGTSVFRSVQKNLEAEGNLDLKSKTLDFGLRYGADKVLLDGTLKLLGTMPHFEGKLEVRGLDLETVTPESYKRGEYLAGKLTAQMQVSLDGANPKILKSSLKGQGTVRISDGALKNRNLVKEVFDRLSPVMAVTGALGGELPPEVSRMLQNRDTPFQSITVSCVVAEGRAQFPAFELIDTDYRLDGKGIYGLLDQRVDAPMQLTLSPAVSGYMIQKIHELQFIADRNGQVSIPFRYAGVIPDAKAQPDLQYIGAQFLQVGADELLNKGLEKLSKFLEPKKK
ncbi:MAG TPA: AsmA family protein [Candidatus Omnitrophota bacterium]|nr:AsmA family protein [Candidatus Omnitrophota bacterium]HPS37619.1 AsmA family protein [Candidatus Omnitrophota bacterium]